jgi:carboxypeptidase family protein/Big-like domain-containing protein
MMSRRTVLLCLAVTLAAGSCSHSDSVTPTPSATTSTDTSTATYPLNGKVVQAGSGTGIPSAALTLVDASGNVTTASTDATGAFSFASAFPAGTYSLQAAAPGYVVSASSVVIPVTSFTMQLPLVGTSPVTTVGVVITGQSTLTIGGTSQLTASVLYSDGTQKDVTTVAKWSSTVPSVATISVSGLVTAYSAGATAIAAAFQDVSGSLVVTTSP